jgi:hypothetical protein
VSFAPQSCQLKVICFGAFNLSAGNGARAEAVGGGCGVNTQGDALLERQVGRYKIPIY